MKKFRGMKIAKRTTRHSHFYRCVKCGQLVDSASCATWYSTRQTTSQIRESLGSEERVFKCGAEKLTTLRTRPRARASRSHCQLHRKRGSQRHSIRFV